jgi:C-terminal processing protease CtpA/Prc
MAKNWYASHTRQHQLSPNAFKGKIYVMINGGSFSASSLISSNLKLQKSNLCEKKRVEPLTEP